MFIGYLIVLAASGALCEESSQYLQETIQDLKMNQEIDGMTRRVYSGAEKEHQQPPPLHLTKAELAALYETAVSNGETIKLDGGGTKPINAAVHQIDESKVKAGNDKHSGYYYYYYPLKSFVDELTSSGHHHQESIKGNEYHHHRPTEEELTPQVHSHTHQHNVHIETMKPQAVEKDKKSKGLEPLFMAISGFIGMTIMFILSILVLPRFDKLKPKGFKAHEGEVTSITRVAIQAIEGRDCAERLACEAGKAARAFNLYNNRFVKLLRRVAPTAFGRRIDKIGKYTDKKYKCAAIQCKRKNAPKKNPKV